MDEAEIILDSVTELAGAEEGIRELERALGKAKALGRDGAELSRQLEKVREAVRRFQEAHPEAGERGRDAEVEAGPVNRGGAEPVVESGPDAVGASRPEASETGGTGVEAGAPPEVGPEEEVVRDDLGRGPTVFTEMNGGGAGTEAEQFVDPAGRNGSARETQSTATPAPTPAGMVVPIESWDAQGFRRDFERRFGEILDEQNEVRRQAEVWELESARMAGQLAGWETRLRRVEERGRVNRDG